MIDPKENRRSFRVSEPVYLMYERITDREFAQGLEHRKIRLGQDDGAKAKLLDIDARLSEAMFQLNGESEHFGKCITLLNDKINAIAGQLPAFKKTKSEIASQPPQTCDVGADGMAFHTKERLEPGTKLSLRFLLAADNLYVESFCDVIREEVLAENADPSLPYSVAVRFHAMSVSQKEVLIQHMFSRESETLRMRRLQIDAQDN